MKHLPERQSKLHRGLFLDEVKELVGQSYRPRLIIDLTSCDGMQAETIDLLLECVEEVEHADGRVSVAASPETAVILEVTQLISVLDLYPSVLEAMSDHPLSVMMPISDIGTTQAAA